MTPDTCHILSQSQVIPFEPHLAHAIFYVARVMSFSCIWPKVYVTELTELSGQVFFCVKKKKKLSDTLFFLKITLLYKRKEKKLNTLKLYSKRNCDS